MKLEDITKFEKQNPGISVNVFGFEKEVFPLRISKHSGRNVDLIMIGNGKENHYAVISNLSRLLSNQVSRHKEPKFFCRRCLNHFSSQEKLKTHLESCEQFGFLKIEMPKEGEKLKFKIFKDK